MGIIGRNGSGKSTLLQLIAGTLQPTHGTLRTQGRVTALLELGAGFNPDFTGRENVFLSGAVLGLSQKEVEARFDEIAAFADIGEFIDQPVKTYSSGMMMRLAFAVNTCVDPDILIVDEALSVGDAPFQAKCFRRLRQLIDKGVSLLFVSHDIGTVRSICNRALWLKNGHPEIWGEAKQVAREYEKFCWQERGVVLNEPSDSGMEVTRPDNVDPSPGPTASPAPVGPVFAVPPALLVPTGSFLASRAASRYGTESVQVTNVLTTNSRDETTVVFDYGETATFYLLLEIKKAVSSEFMATFMLRDLKGNAVLSAQDVSHRQHLAAPAGARFVVKFSIPLPLHHQKYVLHAAVFGFKNGEALPEGRYDFGNAVLWEVIDEAAIIEVRPCALMPLCGPVHFDLPVEFQPLPDKQGIT